MLADCVSGRTMGLQPWFQYTMVGVWWRQHRTVRGGRCKHGGKCACGGVYERDGGQPHRRRERGLVFFPTRLGQRVRRRRLYFSL